MFLSVCLQAIFSVVCFMHLGFFLVLMCLILSASDQCLLWKTSDILDILDWQQSHDSCYFHQHEITVY